jgi:hypothetical protein
VGNGINIGAVYCVYEDSGFLEESIRRIYPVMDKILILLNTITWAGKTDKNIISETFNILLNIKDEEHKIEIISSFWQDEAKQRNFGNKYLKSIGIEWAFVIDDDELYNTNELQNVIKYLDNINFSVYLVSWQIYWKNTITILEHDNAFFVTIVSTNEQDVEFTYCRNVSIKNKNYFSISQDSLICHHMSYVRTNEKMLRKINSFSHASEISKNWYENVWLKCNKNTENLHPVNPNSFKKTISVNESKYKLL